MQLYFSSGDLDFFWKEQLQALSWFPQVFLKSAGFGVSSLLSLWLDYPFRIVLKLLSTMGLSWFIIEKLLWLSVFILAIYSSYCLARYILKSRAYSLITSVVYTTNTYFLLLFSGGQLGVGLAYAFFPYVVFRSMNFFDKPLQKKDIVSNGLYFAILVMFDLRLAYIALCVMAFYSIWLVCTKQQKLFQIILLIKAYIVSGIITFMLHQYWILPTLLSHAGPADKGADFVNPGMLRFLSFADFSHTLSLLHPNWPENLFGKVYFLQPEYLLIPILAFGSLLFLSKNKEPRTPSVVEAGRNNNHILFFAIVSLLGAFLAKGANPPFGNVYIWMFEHIPGFIMFRDPTKFYLLIALGYSILIPLSLMGLTDFGLRMKDWRNNKIILSISSFVVSILFLSFWCFSIRAVFNGQVKGNFQPLLLTDEYVQLKDILIADSVPSRTLWIPQKENFAYYSDIHPILLASEVFKNASLGEIQQIATQSSFTKQLSDFGVKYVIVPKDVSQKIFIVDYVYNETEKESLIATLHKTSLIQKSEFQEVAVFENPEFREMKITIPEIVNVQEKYANIGLIVSVIVFLIIFL